MIALVALLALAPASLLAPASRGSEPIRVVRPSHAAHELERRLALPEAPPPLRGWLAPIAARAHEPALAAWTFAAPGEAASQAERDAAQHVARRLAADGLPATTVRAIARLGAEELARDERPAARLAALGLPVDLLVHFALEGAASETQAPADARVRRIAERLAAGEDVDGLAAELARASFQFQPAGFEAASESGERDLALVRVQLSRGDWWLGEEDGGNVDLTRQLLESTGDVPFLASIHADHAQRFLELARGFALGARPERLTLVVEPWPLAQWATDSGEPGWTRDGRTIATLVPRHASRGEGAPVFVPGDSFLADGLAAAGHRIVASSLLFQGGNLLCVHDPARDERVLVAGEAELARNVALGLAPEQARAALLAELGADRLLELPAVSFHVDGEVTLRSHAGELLAFVNDTDAGLRLVLMAGLGVLQRGEHLSATDAASATDAIAAGRWADAVALLGPALLRNALSPGTYPQSFADTFSGGPFDPGAPNLQVFVLALDVATARGLLANVRDQDAHAYLVSLLRVEEERRALAELLASQGWRVVPVPALADGATGFGYVNALHDRTRSWIPAFGGLHAELDHAARAAYEAALGPEVQVIAVRAAESQRRDGALHCSAAAYYAP